MLPSHGRSRGFESLIAHHPPHPHDLLLLRHGETTWNAEGRAQGDRLDSPLTARGRAQARAMGGILASLGVGLATHAALTSPLGRAAATAALALGPLGLAARPDPRLREIGMGAWAGLTWAEIARRWPGPPGEGLFALYGRCEGGERVADVAARARAVLRSLDGPAVLVTHGVTLRVLAALALGLAPEAGGEEPHPPQGVVLRVRAGRLRRLDAPLARTGGDL